MEESTLLNFDMKELTDILSSVIHQQGKQRTVGRQSILAIGPIRTFWKRVPVLMHVLTIQDVRP